MEGMWQCGWRWVLWRTLTRIVHIWLLPSTLFTLYNVFKMQGTWVCIYFWRVPYWQGQKGVIWLINDHEKGILARPKRCDLIDQWSWKRNLSKAKKVSFDWSMIMKEESWHGFNKKMDKPLRKPERWITMKPPLKKFSFKKIVPTLKLKLMAAIDSKIIQRRPTKGY